MTVHFVPLLTIEEEEMLEVKLHEIFNSRRLGIQLRIMFDKFKFSAMWICTAKIPGAWRKNNIKA
jgi:hypothetical protein